MVRLVALIIGLISAVIVTIVGFMNDVTWGSIMIRSIGVFFLFYMIGTLIGVIIVQNTLMVFIKKKKLKEMQELKERTDILQKKKIEMEKLKEESLNQGDKGSVS